LIDEYRRLQNPYRVTRLPIPQCQSFVAISMSLPKNGGQVSRRYNGGLLPHSLRLYYGRHCYVLPVSVPSDPPLTCTPDRWLGSNSAAAGLVSWPFVLPPSRQSAVPVPTGWWYGEARGRNKKREKRAGRSRALENLKKANLGNSSKVCYDSPCVCSDPAA